MTTACDIVCNVTTVHVRLGILTNVDTYVTFCVMTTVHMTLVYCDYCTCDIGVL